MERDDIYRKHILDAVNKIKSYVKKVNYDTFLKTPLIQDAVIRELEIIGEAAKNLSNEFKEKYSKVPWRYVTGMRDKLIHDYFKVNLEAVWKTILEDLTQLKKELSKYKK